VYSEIVVAAIVFVAASLAFGQAPAVPCVAPDVNSPVLVNAGPPAARIYFRATGTPSYYYVNLKPAAAGFSGVLPRPLKGTSVEYQIETADASGARMRGASTVLGATSGCAPALDAMQSQMASNLIVGQTADTANVPPGFDCKGIVSVITPGDELKSNSCPRSPLGYYIGGAAAVAAGVMIYDHNHGNQRHHPPSPSTP
jgi:hypothetical protein